MSCRRVFTGVLVFASMVLSASASDAEVFRGTFVIAKPTQFAGALAVNRAVDVVARQALAEQFIRERLSGVLVRRRESQVRTALEPLTDLMKGFNVIRRLDVAGDAQQVVCEADIDVTDVVLKLVNGNVLSFGQFSPRLLVWPGNASPDAVQALRGQISEHVRATGVTLLANEAVAAPPAGSPRSLNGRGMRADADAARRDAMLAAATDAGANFVASMDITAVPIPVPGVGVALDVNIHYTLMRPSDARILGERTISTRGGGANVEVALQRVLADKGAEVAKGLAGDVATAIFKNGRAIDPVLPANRITINIAERPNASATSALLDLLRERAFTASLGTGRAAPVAGVAIEDRVVVEGRGVTVEDVFDLLANTRFGRDDALLASIYAHGADHLDVELIDVNRPPARQPITQIDTPSESGAGPSVGGGGPSPTSEPIPQPLPIPNGPRGMPPLPSPSPLPLPGPRAGGPMTVASAGTRPLEYEFSEAFKTATRPAGARGRQP